MPKFEPKLISLKSQMKIWREREKGDWTGKVGIRQKKKFLAMSEACMAIF